MYVGTAEPCSFQEGIAKPLIPLCYIAQGDGCMSQLELQFGSYYFSYY